ncbi:MAG: glucokinase [Desulfomicrobium sp.]
MAHILAADIGGTNSRFGLFEVVTGLEPRLLDSLSVPTASVASLSELMRLVRDKGFDPGLAERVVVAAAGPVRDGVCDLTNASWSIDLRDPGARFPLERTALINDFVAQALGCTSRYAAESSILIQEGLPRPGVVAAVGPGTGLGLCALIPLPGGQGDFLPLPSEGGHAPLAFAGDREFGFLRFLRERTGYSHAFGDIVVSGRGLAAMHLFLTGRDLAAVEVAREIGPGSETSEWFARFFARACRAYVLHVLAWGGLYLCGGIAAKNPFLAKHPAFLREFTDCPAYGHLLAHVPIHLVTAPDTGLHGAAGYGRTMVPKKGGAQVFVA